MSELPPELSEISGQPRHAEWLVGNAPAASGSLLVGPHIEGAQAIIPPGRLVATPEGSAEDYCEDGWRLAVWPYAEGTQAPTFQLHEYAQPQSLHQLSFRETAALVNLEAPHQLNWLQDVLHDHYLWLANSFNTMLEDGETELATDLRHEMQTLVLDATLECGEDWVKQAIMPPYSTLTLTPGSTGLPG